MSPTVNPVQESDDLELSWPQDVSHEPSLRIGEVIELLNGEFPFLAASKIRHFESQDLISPQRTPSNQRLFSLADVERLRFILVEQRDRYMSLTQIKEMLGQLDRGEAQNQHPGHMRVLKDDEVVKPKPGTRLRKEDLSELVGVPVATIDRYIEMGLITADSRGRLTSHAVDIVRYASMLEESNMDIRKIRSVRNSAHQHAVNVVQMLETERSRNTPVARERVATESGELAAMLTNMYRALLLESIDVELR